MREEFYSEIEKEESKKKQIVNLESQEKLLRKEVAKTDKILKEEEIKNFKINKRYYKISSVTPPPPPCFYHYFCTIFHQKLDEKEQEAQEINRQIEDLKYKNYHNFYDKDFTEKLEKKVREIFDEHFASANFEEKKEMLRFLNFASFFSFFSLKFQESSKKMTFLSFSNIREMQSLSNQKENTHLMN